VIDYVIVLALRNKTDFVLIEKQKPEWMRGLFNLPGGKVELFETSAEAAIRELYEECGIHSLMPEYIGRIESDDFRIFCYKTEISQLLLNPRECEVERVFWTTWDEIKNDKRLIQNLRIIIPMMIVGSKDWIIFDKDNETSIRFFGELK